MLEKEAYSVFQCLSNTFTENTDYSNNQGLCYKTILGVISPLFSA